MDELLYVLGQAFGWALAYLAFTYLRDWLIWHLDGLCIRLWMAVAW